MTLSILICTTVDRRPMFEQLKGYFEKQIADLSLEDQVELLYIEDNKEMSVGSKRQKLLEMATGDWIVFFDSDDMPSDKYVYLVYEAIRNNPDIDCIGINIRMTTNGNRPQKCCHRLLYPEWMNNFDGWDYVRNITHFNPVKRALALQTGFKDMRFGEDKDYSDRLLPLLKKEFYIREPLFHYRYSSSEPHKKKYGIK